MRTRSSTAVASFFAAMVALGTTTAFAGDATEAPILGRLDRITGAFVPNAAVAPPAASAVRSGTLRFVISITYTSAAPAGKPLPACKVTVTHSGADLYYYTEHGSAKAARAGATGSCTVTVPYLWQHASTTDVVYYEVELTTSAADYAVGTLPFFHATQVHTPKSFALPAHGVTKTVSVARKY